MTPQKCAASAKRCAEKARLALPDSEARGRYLALAAVWLRLAETGPQRVGQLPV